MTFLTKCQVKDLVKMDKCPWINQIDHIEWIKFSKSEHFDLTFSQIDHYDLTLNQMNDIHLMT